MSLLSVDVHINNRKSWVENFFHTSTEETWSVFLSFMSAVFFVEFSYCSFQPFSGFESFVVTRFGQIQLQSHESEFEK